jgi:hypothetical protein
MFIEILLPALTAIGSASIAWYLARVQKQADWLAKVEKLKSSLEREKQRNKVLANQLELVNARLQFAGTLRSVEVAALRACVPQDLIQQLDRSPLLAISQSLDSTFHKKQAAQDAAPPIPERKRMLTAKMGEAASL